MKKNQTHLLLSLASLLFITACNPVCEDCKQTTGYEYFPLAVGQYTEYDIAEEEYALGRDVVVKTYQWKESVVEKYQDGANQTAFRIVRYKRANDTQKWQPDSSFSARQALDQVVKNENGRDYIKLVFPIADRLTWNGNVFNNLGEDKYELKNVLKPYKVKSQTLDKTITVVQQNDSTLVGQDKRIEVYAENIGLIYKESINLQLCSSSPSCVGKGQIDYGKRRFVKYRKNGIE